jgi:hypothetical protein
MIGRLARIIERRGLLGTAIMVADRITRPFGLSLISFSRLAAIPPPPKGPSAKSRFDRIATDNLWGSDESLSGAGSEVARTEQYRQALVRLIWGECFHSLFDAPCGDLNWMPLVLDQVEVDYVGGDISPALIQRNRERYPALNFVEFDITSDDFPEADVWHCRDCLFHLSYRDIELALRNFARSDIPHALITSHSGLIRNVDVESGGWRYLDLRRPPFNLPGPRQLLPDYQFGDLPRFVGLWSRDQIEQALSRNRETQDAL